MTGVAIMRLFAAAALICCSCPISAAETKTYTYDALGRLQATVTSGGPANGVSTTTNYDKADNRTRYSVTGSNNRPPIGKIIVVPINRYSVIAIPLD